MFYQVDQTRIPLRRLFQSSSIPALILGLPIVLVRKLFRIPSLVPAAIPDSLQPFLVDRSAIPEDIQARMEPLEGQVRSCGFIDPVYHWIVDPFSARRIGVATYRHRAGTSLGQVRFVEVGQQQPARRSLAPLFLTAYSDGTLLSSSNASSQVVVAPCCKRRSFPGTSVPELWRRHGQQVSLESAGKSTVLVHSPAETLDLLEKVEATERDFLVQRGILVPRTEAEQQTVEAVMATPGDETNREFAAVYAEMNRLANHKASWTSGLITLAVTVAVFFAAMNRGGHAWKPLVLLSGVLLVHELGHLAAMRLFHYRNLRMFFIPFFGAAVTGQNYNVPGWKKAIVALMGPLPGIALGTALGIVGIIARSPTVIQAAFLFLAINAFNLLPIVPLDGGRVVHAVLFSRHPIFDAAFRLVAALILMLSALAGTRMLAVLGVVMFLGLRMNYRVGTVVHRLRHQGLDAASPDARTIPFETARRIHDELRAALPAHLPAKASAQWTLQAFELLNARPPGAIASLALLGAHGFAFCAAVVVCLTLVVAQHGRPRHRAGPPPGAPGHHAARLEPSPRSLPDRPANAQAWRVRARAHPTTCDDTRRRRRTTKPATSTQGDGPPPFDNRCRAVLN
jgi:Zn-dependent protease